MSRCARTILLAACLGALALPGRAAAQLPKAPTYPYVAIDIGTLGGPQAQFDIPGTVITAQGDVVAQADTPISDTDYPNFNPTVGLDPFIEHAVLWHRGVLTDLGALPGNNSSALFNLTARGDGAGMSESGALNPFTGLPETQAVLWQGTRLIPLEGLGGTDSFGVGLNSQGQVVGMATNTTPDPYTLATWINEGTQLRAALWQDGTIHNLGTLGGPDSAASYVNERGQVAGDSFTSAIPNPVTGQPPQDPFLWTNGHMRDLGTLGGTDGYTTIAGIGLNDRGEVVGASDLAGDLTSHPFLWDGTAMRDLCTAVGAACGDYGEAHAINQAGDVAGWATTPGDVTAHAFLWENGVLTDLDGATSTACHYADSVNASDQVVGGSCGTNADGWLWEHGTLSDLNTLVAPSSVQLTEAHYINDRGEIAVAGVLPNGAQHIILLIPTGEANRDGLRPNLPAPGAVGPAASAAPLHGLPLNCLTTPLWQTRRSPACHRLTGGPGR
jgi:probable HAF family extracellular repeat protein